MRSQAHIFLKFIIVVGLVFIISSSAQAGFVTVNPFEDINNPSKKKISGAKSK